jgi:hypothetical protein
MNAVFFLSNLYDGPLRVKATVKDPSTLGIGYKRTIKVGKAYRWSLARQSTSR